MKTKKKKTQKTLNAGCIGTDARFTQKGKFKEEKRLNCSVYAFTCWWYPIFNLGLFSLFFLLSPGLALWSSFLSFVGIWGFKVNVQQLIFFDLVPHVSRGSRGWIEISWKSTKTTILWDVQPEICRHWNPDVWKPLRADVLNAVNVRRGLTCTLV